MKCIFATLPLLALASTSAFAAIEPTPFPFDVNQLSGVWADSVDTEPACAMKNGHFRYEFSSDRKRLAIQFDREIDSGAAGKVSHIDATVLAATARTITFRYDGEQRMNSLGKPIEWQLAMVAPGVLGRALEMLLHHVGAGTGRRGGEADTGDRRQFRDVGRGERGDGGGHRTALSDG